MNTVDDRIDKGIALLDDKAPDWRGLVDWENLAMSDPNWCVVGQVSNHHYIAGLRALGLDAGDAGEHGFEITRYGESYRDLTIAWKERLS